jgi:hypothetical protein
MQVPSMVRPSYSIGEDVSCVPLNELPRVAGRYDEFVVIGAGKTGMDACVWLLGNGADPDRIRWIMPRDSWVLDRRNVQPGDELFAAFCKSLADHAHRLLGGGHSGSIPPSPFSTVTGSRCNGSVRASRRSAQR